jgi:hypothetical protein
LPCEGRGGSAVGELLLLIIVPLIILVIVFLISFEYLNGDQRQRIVSLSRGLSSAVLFGYSEDDDSRKSKNREAPRAAASGEEDGKAADIVLYSQNVSSAHGSAFDLESSGKAQDLLVDSQVQPASSTSVTDAAAAPSSRLFDVRQWAPSFMRAQQTQQPQHAGPNVPLNENEEGGDDEEQKQDRKITTKLKILITTFQVRALRCYLFLYIIEDSCKP